MSQPEPQELDRFLEQMRVSGDYDSEGVFTLSESRAMGKLSEFLLAEKSDWILKLVQAACAGKASDIRIRQTHRSTQILFCWPYTLDLIPLEQALTSGTGNFQQEGVSELATALRAVGRGQSRDWVLSIVTTTIRAYLSSTGGDLAVQRSQCTESVQGTEIALGVSYPANESGKLGGFIRFGEAVQNEHAALQLKTRACPIPITLDNTRLDDLGEPSLATALQPRVFLGINSIQADGEAELIVPRELNPTPKPVPAAAFHTAAPFLVERPPVDRKAKALLRWFYNYSKHDLPTRSKGYMTSVEAASKVHLVRHGVIVGRKGIGFSHPVSADIFLSADHLRTDLTGLRVEPSSTESELAKEAMRASRPYLISLLSELDGVKLGPQPKDMLLCGGLLALTVVSPWFGLKALTGVGSGVLIAREVKKDRDALRRCRHELQNFLADKLTI